jgi:hypothetical protein
MAERARRSRFRAGTPARDERLRDGLPGAVGADDHGGPAAGRPDRDCGWSAAGRIRRPGCGGRFTARPHAAPLDALAARRQWGAPVARVLRAVGAVAQVVQMPPGARRSRKYLSRNEERNPTNPVSVKAGPAQSTSMVFGRAQGPAQVATPGSIESRVWKRNPRFRPYRGPVCAAWSLGTGSAVPSHRRYPGPLSAQTLLDRDHRPRRGRSRRARRPRPPADENVRRAQPPIRGPRATSRRFSAWPGEPNALEAGTANRSAQSNLRSCGKSACPIGGGFPRTRDQSRTTTRS